MQTKLERDYQSGLIQRIYRRFPGCEVLKNDTSYRQGIPDLSVFALGGWGVFEVKRKEPKRESDWEPNQQYWLGVFGEIGFAACIYPENEEEILDAFQQSLRPRRSSRVPKPQ